MIVHIPHSSKALPKVCKFDLTAEEIRCEMERMTDIYTDTIFAHENAIIFPYSRLFCDVERFVDDEMETVGMGISYRRTSDGKRLYKDHPDTPEEIVKASMEHYFEHHRKFKEMIHKQLESGFCLIVDAHSFPAEPLPYERDYNRPDICIGTNAWDTKISEFAEIAETHFREKGYYNVAHNSPFKGSIAPVEGVSSVMIEVNRRLYDGQHGDLERITAEIQELLRLFDQMETTYRRQR